MTVEVLVATMHRKDHELLADLNLQTDAIVINQTDRSGCEELEYNGRRVLWVDTEQRGLSRSRNMALSYATADICLLADDDMVYADGYEQLVLDAFDRQKKADIIAFNIEANTQERKNSVRPNTKNRPAPKNRYYGGVRLGFRRNAVLKAGVLFNVFLGAGAQYKAGEESLFLRECRKKGVRIFEHTACLGRVDFATSTWFTGYNDEYYRNKGVFTGFAYGRYAWFFGLYYVLQGIKVRKMAPLRIYRNICKGIQEYKKL